MAFVPRTMDAVDIPIVAQHQFLDRAKEFQWKQVEQLLIEAPSLINAQPCGRDGTKRWSALHQAAYGGHVSAVRRLLAHGAALEATTSDGQTSLDVARRDDIRVILRTAERAKLVPTLLRALPATRPSNALRARKAKKTSPRKKMIAKGKRGKVLVYKGKFEKTMGGLRKEQLVKNKHGKIVSTRMQAHGKKAYANIENWVSAMMKARAELGLVGFVLVSKGSSLYARTKHIYEQTCRK